MTNTTHIIDTVFGGIRPMARLLEISHVTVASWKSRGNIPSKRQQEILDVARQHGLELTPADFFDAA